MNRGRGEGWGGGVGSQKNPKEDQSGRWLTERIQCAKHIRLTCVQTPPPLKQIGEKRGGGVCTQTKIRELNRRSDDFN